MDTSVPGWRRIDQKRQYWVMLARDGVISHCVEGVCCFGVGFTKISGSDTRLKSFEGPALSMTGGRRVWWRFPG